MAVEGEVGGFISTGLIFPPARPIIPLRLVKAASLPGKYFIASLCIIVDLT